MPSRYVRDAARLKAETVGRVDAGERLRAVCGAPGMPCVQTVRDWARADAAFGEALAAARRRGDWRRLWGFDEAKAAAFLARARAGEPIHDLLREPAMPSRRAYDRWRTAQPPFAEATFALLKRRDAQLGDRGRARRRDFDRRLADRIIVGLNKGHSLEAVLAAVLAADPELPCKPVVARWRREQLEFDRVLRMLFAAWRGRRGALTPVPAGMTEAVTDHIVEGGSFASFSAQPGGPSRSTLRRWFARDRAFATAVSQACEDREDWYSDQIIMATEPRAPGAVHEKARAVGAMKRHLVRLRHRPGAVHRARAPALPQQD